MPSDLLLLEQPRLTYGVNGSPDDKPGGLIQNILQHAMAAGEIRTASVMKRDRDTHPLGFAIGQLHGIYILSQNADSLVIVDMHAAHERILYEQLKHALETQAVATQTLSTPLSMQADPLEAGIVADNRPTFLKLGFDITVLSPDTLAIRAVPALLQTADLAALVRDVIHDLQIYGGSHAITEHQHKILGTLACHRAVRANQPLTLDEMNKLLRKMEETDRAGQCNHGAPTWHDSPAGGLDKCFMPAKQQ